MPLVDFLHLTAKITRPRTKAFLARFGTRGAVLDIGCGNDLYRDIFPNKKTLELNPRGAVDFEADAEDMPIVPSDSFDVVLLMGVMEHMKNPANALQEIHRVLKKGGLLLMAVPFIYPIHDYPSDHWRFTEEGLKLILKDFKIEAIEEQANTMETLAILFQRIGFQCTTLRWRPMKLFWFLLAKIFLLLRNVITEQAGDIGKKTRVKNILVAGYHVAARKV